MQREVDSSLNDCSLKIDCRMHVYSLFILDLLPVYQDEVSCSKWCFVGNGTHENFRIFVVEVAYYHVHFVTTFFNVHNIFTACPAYRHWAVMCNAAMKSLSRLFTRWQLSTLPASRCFVTDVCYTFYTVRLRHGSELVEFAPISNENGFAEI